MTLSVSFDDGSEYELDENEEQAIAMKYPDHDAETVLTKLAKHVDKHWEQQTVPTKFGDDSWSMYAREHTDELPPVDAVEERVKDDMDWDETIRDLFGTDDVPIPDPAGMDMPLTAHLSGGKVYEDPDDMPTIHLPEVDEPSTVEAFSDTDSPVTIVVVPEPMYEEYKEYEVKFHQQVAKRMEGDSARPFETKADLAAKVIYQHLRAPLMSLAMQELSDEDSPGVIDLNGSAYQGDEGFHKR